MSDGLTWATAVDTTGADEGFKRIEDGFKSTCDNIEVESERIQSLLSDIPEPNIQFVTNMPETADQIGEAYAEIARITRVNGEAINELSAEYNRLTENINKFQNVPSKRDEVAKWRQERDAIKENISIRKDMIAKTQELTKVVEQNEKAFTKHQTTQTNVKTRIREVMQEMAALRNEAQMNGQTIDESTGRYRELAEELGRLKDIQGDVQTQAKILSSDEGQFQGIISGLTGMSGAMTAAQGAMSLLGGENENLQRVMIQLQSVMAITMGLQQVQQMLNKDSAFTLVTLNSLRKLWNKLMGESNAVQAVNNAETATSAATTEAQAAATTTATVVEEANTAAQTANNAATNTGTAGKVAETTATEGATVAQNAHTGAIVAGTVATKAMAVAMRVLKLALISTGIGALIVLVGELVSWIVDLCSAEDEAREHADALNDVHKEAAKTYLQEKVALQDNIKMCQTFKGTKEQEKKKVEELNSKYGEALGYYDSLEQWERVLVERGPAYCKLQQLKAERQGILNKYVESYCDLLEVQHKAENGDYDAWYRTKNGDLKKRQEEINKAKRITDQWEAELARQDALIEQFQRENNLDEVHIDTRAKNISGSGVNAPKPFDPKEAAKQQREAIRQWKEAVIRYTREANQEVTQANIDAMEEGMAKEIRQIQARTEAQKNAWKQHLLQLAQQMKDSEKMIYLSKKGHTEEGWEDSERGRMSTADYANEILARPENAEMAEQYYDRLQQIVTTGENAVAALQRKYQDKWIKDYGTTLQKNELAQREWFERLQRVQAEAPELYSQVWDAMEKDMAARGTAVFKESINWGDVFGNLENQSLQSLQFTLNKVREYFNRAKDDMSVTEIKDFQEAIANMEDEIASRNPFTAMHHSFSQISSAKTELVAALQEFTEAQQALNAETEEFNRINAEHSRLLEIKGQSDQNDELYALEQAQEHLIETERAYQSALQSRADIQAQIDSGELAADCQELANANELVTQTEQARNEAMTARDTAQSLITDQEAAAATIELVTNNEQLAASLQRVTTAETNAANAEQRVLTARNKVTKSYKQFARDLKSAGGVVTDIGGKATKLAKIFSDDIGDAMEKSLEFIDEVLDATADVISAIGDVGKSVAKGMTQTVDAMGTATKATATATATSISTVEKASIILTVISAALQIATAIANLFNNDDAKQKEIEKLQERIDQLQWELDNADTVRLQNNSADAMKKLAECYRDAYNEVLRLHGVTQQTSYWVRWITAAIHSAEIYAGTIEKIADYWGSVNYTADKALGAKKYEDSRKQLENLAEQQLLIQKQINEEESKKKTDSGKVQDYKNQIAEIAEEMATLINEMLEDIMGTTAEDLSKTLGDAFFDAVSQGEDAMKSWAATTKSLVADIIKQMLVTQFIEGQIGQIFDKYKKKWFGDDGSFKGIDAVIDSADALANDINQVGENFNAIWDGLSGSLGKWFEEDADREGTSKGIATASQESVDENNARLTTIQGHTYSLVQGVNDLNGTANAMLERLTGIENNTTEANEKLDTVNARIKTVADTLETIQTSGLRLK